MENSNASAVVSAEGNNLPIDTERLRDDIKRLADKLATCPPESQVELEVMHHFSDGIYCRTVLMKAGDMVVGKIHKKEHVVVISSGHALVVSEEFGPKEIIAPAIFTSPPGARRALLILSDMVWTTVHKNSTNTQDLAKLEDELIAKDYAEIGGSK